MALLNKKSLGNIELLLVDADPSGALSARQGSIAFLSTGANVWQNTNGGTTWARSDAQAAHAVRVQKLTKTIGHADLTAAAAEQTINFDAALPANAFVFGGTAVLNTNFTGGAITAATVEIGGPSDLDGVCTAMNIFSGAVTGLRLNGVLPPMASQTPSVTVRSTGGNVVDFNAGSVEANIYYFVP